MAPCEQISILDRYSVRKDLLVVNCVLHLQHIRIARRIGPVFVFVVVFRVKSNEKIKKQIQIKDSEGYTYMLQMNPLKSVMAFDPP